MSFVDDLFCSKTFTIVILHLKGASIVISVKGTVTVDVVMYTLIHLSFPFQTHNQGRSQNFLKGGAQPSLACQTISPACQMYCSVATSSAYSLET